MLKKGCQANEANMNIINVYLSFLPFSKMDFSKCFEKMGEPQIHRGNHCVCGVTDAVKTM
jgi:hypothetical protein